jgi:glycosyltransferase involved in cell wall biosynthesis
VAEGLVIIPAYNEEKNIDEVLKKIIELGIKMDIVVINDGSRDNTLKIVRQNNVKVISNPFNLGYGGALQTGFKYAVIKGYKYIIQFDADGQHQVQDIELIRKELEKGDIDIVVGSRFIGKGSFKAGFFKRRVIKLMRFLIKASTGTAVTDPTSGLKGLSQRTFTYYSNMGSFPYDYPDADILIKMLKLKYKVREIPIDVLQRDSGTSMHSGLKPVVYVLKVLLSIFIVLLRDLIEKET